MAAELLSKLNSQEEGQQRRTASQRKLLRNAFEVCIAFRVRNRTPDAARPETAGADCTLTTAQRVIQYEGQLQNGVMAAFGRRQANDFKVTKQLVSGSSDEKIKLIRAQGGCQGTIRRRKTWQAAKSYGEPQAGNDP